jgi:hypothetical protein
MATIISKIQTTDKAPIFNAFKMHQRMYRVVYDGFITNITVRTRHGLLVKLFFTDLWNVN